MAESVQDLVVRLSFQHGDTRSQIAAIKGELKLLDSEFKAAAAAAGGLSSGMNTSAAKAGQLEKKLNVQRQVVEKYASALKEAEQRVQSATKRHEEYGAKLESAKARQAEMKAEMKAYKKSMAEVAGSEGKESEAYTSMEKHLKELEEAYHAQGDEVKRLSEAYARADQSIANADKGLMKLTREANEARAVQSDMERELSGLNERIRTHADALEAASQKMQGYADAAKNAGQWQTKAGDALSKGSAAIVSAGVAAAGAAISWESGFTDVRKTVSGTDEELSKLEQDLLDMASAGKKAKAVKLSDLTDIAATAGQMGIKTQNVANFTGVMADLAQTTDLTADAAAMAFSQYANITRMPQEQMERLGSVTVALGNNLATTESRIVNFASRIAAAGSQAGLTDAQIFGLAGGLSSLGLEAEAGGTAFSKALSGMQAAVETGSEDLESYAAVAGMSAEKFARAFREDAAGAFIAFVQGLSSGSQSAIVMLDEMGVNETRMRDTLLRASNASDLLTGSIEMANGAWKENTALSAEAATRYGTSASRMQILGNKVQRTAIAFGNSLMPVFEQGIGTVEKVVEKFASLDEGQRQQIITWGTYAAAAGPALKLLGKANNAIGTVTGGLGKLFSAMAGGSASLSGLIGGVGKLLGPAGVLTLAAGAGVLAYKFYDWASGAKAAREATEAMNDAAREMLETQARTLYDTGTADPLARFGLSRESFASSEKTAQDWLADLNRVWTDGKRETDKEVKSFTDGFVSASDGVRDKINARGSLLEGLNVLDDGAKAKMQADLDQLDAWDAEIEALLKKRKGGMLSEADQARLGEVIRLRAELELDYSMGNGSGYDAIIQGMNAEVARLTAAGADADASIYGDALNALAEGRKAYNDSLSQSYDAEYAQIQAIGDEAARTEALAALNEKYNAQRLEGERAYQQAVAEAGAETWKANGFEEQVALIDELTRILTSGELNLEQLSEWTQNLDEGKMTSMLAMVEQLRASGMDDSQLAELGVDADDLLAKIQQIRDLASNTEGLDGLASIFGEALPEEVQRVLVGLDMTQAAADWEAFMADKQTFETWGSLSITLNDLDRQALDAWEQKNSTLELTGPMAKVGVALGTGWQGTLRDAFEAGKLEIYGEDGAKLTVTPELVSTLTGNDLIALDEDGTYHVIVTPVLGETGNVEKTIENAHFQETTGYFGVKIETETMPWVDEINELAQNAEQAKAQIDSLNEAYAGLGNDNYTSAMNEVNAAFDALTQLDLDALALEAANLMAALANPDLDPELARQYADELAKIQELVANADNYLGTGSFVAEGIAQGMTGYGWAADAGTLASDLLSAVNGALGVASPATTMVPTGTNVAAGIAEGMSAYAWAAAAGQVSGGIQGAFSGMNAAGRQIGSSFGQGLMSGLTSKMRSTVALARTYAAQVTQAFRSAWQIHSPSKVAAGLTDMFGAGLEEGMRAWPTVSSRVLEDDVLGARQGLQGLVKQTSDNRNFSATSNVYVDKMEIRDEQDIRALALELNALTRRDQRARGLRT